jgi:hypothetical protein
MRKKNELIYDPTPYSDLSRGKAGKPVRGPEIYMSLLSLLLLDNRRRWRALGSLTLRC